MRNEGWWNNGIRKKEGIRIRIEWARMPKRQNMVLFGNFIILRHVLYILVPGRIWNIKLGRSKGHNLHFLASCIDDGVVCYFPCFLFSVHGCMIWSIVVELLLLRVELIQNKKEKSRKYFSCCAKFSRTQRTTVRRRSGWCGLSFLPSPSSVFFYSSPLLSWLACVEVMLRLQRKSASQRSATQHSNAIELLMVITLA